MPDPLPLSMRTRRNRHLLVMSLDRNGSENHCSGIWSEYVDHIKGMAFANHLSRPFIFVDRDGRVYDCLNLGIDPAQLQVIEVAEKALPLDRASPLSVDPATWPVNVCSVGSADWINANYFAVSLPEDTIVLSTSACRNRVFRGVERLILDEEQ
jgi:hypothetical protein